MPGVAGYMMKAGHVSENLESSGDLNRRSQDGVPRAFYVTFCTTQKVTIRSLCREHRGSANLDSARRNGGFARTKLKPFPKGASRFCKPRISTQNYKSALTKLNSSAASRLLPAASPPKTFPAGNVSILFVRHKKYAKKAILPPAAAISRRQRRLAVLFANRKAPYQKYLTR